MVEIVKAIIVGFVLVAIIGAWIYYRTNTCADDEHMENLTNYRGIGNNATLCVSNCQMPTGITDVQAFKQMHKCVDGKSYREVRDGEIAIFLSCTHLCPKDILKRNKHNLIVHQSDLPQGKGWSPTTWQVLEGKNRIVTTLFEASEKMDAGDYYLKGVMVLEPHELIDEIRYKQAENAFGLIKDFLAKYPIIKPIKQKGKSSFYPKRTPKDSELDINKSIKAQFNLLRVVDNNSYPAFFRHLGKRYTIRIEKVDKDG